MTDKSSMAFDSMNYFWNVLHSLFYEDDADEDLRMDMDMFSEYCKHIRNTYQLFFNGGSHTEMLCMLRPFHMLAELYLFPEIIDEDHDIVQEFAKIATIAIIKIADGRSEENRLAVNGFCWYDFERDTPEAVWNRIKNAL